MANRSIRKKLLLWLLLPLMALIVVDSSILYRVAMHFQHDAFDHSLTSSAQNIAELVHESAMPAKRFQLRAEVRQAILTDPVDQMYYSVIDERGTVIGGDDDLKLTIHPLHHGRTPYFSYSNIRGTPVRVVTSYATLNTTNGIQHVYIQVAETLNKRNRLASQILVGIVVPQLVLVLAAVALVWLGTGRGLQPLWELHSSLARRSHRDLSPVQLSNTPDEVKVLVDSVNLFMLQLKNVLESQNRFIADAAHQLRTPLAGMQAQLELALEETDPEQLKSSLISITGSLERLSHLVNQLLVLARNQPEVMRTLDMQEINLSHLAQDVAMDMVPTALLKNIDLGFEGSVIAPMIRGDAQRLQEMLYNLIDNAIRYSQAGAKVTVRTAIEAVDGGDMAVLSVTDNGTGIPSEEHERVFERFHRVIGSNQEGSGLGLAIVMEIAHIHEARVTLGDTKEGVGTRVNIMFNMIVSQADRE